MLDDQENYPSCASLFEEPDVLDFDVDFCFNREQVLNYFGLEDWKDDGRLLMSFQFPFYVYFICTSLVVILR